MNAEVTFDRDILLRAETVLIAARRRGAMVVTAESCTGGLVAAALTAIAGSSDAVDGGFVTYSNAAKERLGVASGVLLAHGAVSAATARALAEAALVRSGGPSGARLAVSVTGIAGPGGGSDDRPVGLVHFAATDGVRTIDRAARFGDIGRDPVRRASVLAALDLLIELCRD